MDEKREIFGNGSDEDISDDDGLSLLPRYTKVVVTGNNRTKTALVGLHGVVKKAVGLGGWHWLTLANGDEVRLQRNALSVLEHPTQEQMEENQAEEAREAKATAAALAVGAGAGEGARHQPHHAGGGGTFPRSDERLGFHSSRPKRPPHLVGAQGSRPHLSSQHARSVLRGRVQPPGSARPHNGGMKREHAGVNFAKLETGSLRKYRRYYKLEVGPNASKDQLVHAVKAHFSGQTVDEGNVLTGFILALHGASHSHM